MSIRRVSKMCVPGVAVLSLMISYTTAAQEDLKTQLLAPGTPAPSFSLPTLAGERQTLGVWCGKNLTKPYFNNISHTIIISFWATYCKPCQKEIPELMKFMEKHNGEPVKAFCISLDKEGASVVAPFVKEKGFTLPVLLDPYSRTAERYGVKTLPALVVIGPDGIIRYAGVGYKDGESFGDLLERALQSARDGKNLSLNASESVIGETVQVKIDAKEVVAPATLTPRDRWQAIARVECGESLKNVSDELGVTEEQLKQWYAELKQAALDLWKSSATDKQ